MNESIDVVGLTIISAVQSCFILLVILARPLDYEGLWESFPTKTVGKISDKLCGNLCLNSSSFRQSFRETHVKNLNLEQFSQEFPQSLSESCPTVFVGKLSHSPCQKGILFIILRPGLRTIGFRCPGRKLKDI